MLIQAFRVHRERRTGCPTSLELLLGVPVKRPLQVGQRDVKEARKLHQIKLVKTLWVVLQYENQSLVAVCSCSCRSLVG